MRIGLAFRNEIMGIPGGSWVVEQFDSLVARIAGVWSAQHNDDGSHRNITAGTGTFSSTLDVAGTTTLLGFVGIGGAHSGPGSQLEVYASGDALVKVISGSDSGFPFREAGYIMNLYDDSGVQRKAGVMATTVADGDTTSGYFATNIHSTYVSGGVSNDDIWLVGWGANGAAFFPADTTAAEAPGTGILKVNGTLHATTALKERSRAAAVGEWTAVAHAGGNFTADTGTWTVESADQVVYRYMLVGKTMWLNVVISTSTTSGSPNQLRIAVPGGFTIAHNSAMPDLLYNDGAWVSGGALELVSGGSYVSAYHSDYGATNWNNVADGVYLRFLIAFEVQ